jgi:hypothetical protein
MRLLAAIPLLFLLSGCVGSGTAYPTNDQAIQTGVPKVEFMRYGVGRGPVTITMPDGEVLKGEYRVISNVGIGFGFGARGTATAIGVGGGSPVAASALGDHGTVMTCDGAVDLGGRGVADCETNRGARYRMMF